MSCFLKNKSLILILVLLLSSAIVGPAMAQSEKPAATDGEVIELTDDEKIIELQEKLALNPADGQSWNDLGVIYANAENYPEARNAFIKAVQSDPTEADYHRNLGMVFSRLDMYEIAIAEFGQYRENDLLGGHDYWRLIGGAQLKAGLIEDARQTYQDGIAAFAPTLGAPGFRLVLRLSQMETEQGNDPAVRDLLDEHFAAAENFLNQFEDDEFARGQAGYAEAQTIVHNRISLMVADAKLMEESNLYAEATKIYEEAYELEPERDDLLPRLVGCYLKQDMTLEAGVAARMARDKHPEKSGTWIATGKVYEHTDKRDEAIEAYKKAYEIDEIDDLRVAIGNLYMRMGNDKQASSWLKAGLSSGSNQPEVVYNYAVSLMREKKFHAAIPSLKNVTSELPDFYNGWLALAQCYQMTKQYAAAVEPYQQAFNIQPDAKGAFHMGRMAEKSKQFDKSIESYVMSLLLDPTYEKAQYNLALSYMGAKRYDEAAVAFDALVEMTGPSYKAYYSQGLSYYYLGEYDAALEAYDLAMVEKETVNVFNNIGLVYDKLGDKKEAAKWYKSAQNLKAGS